MVFVAIVSNGADCSHDRAGEGSSRSRSLGTPSLVRFGLCRSSLFLAARSCTTGFLGHFSRFLTATFRSLQADKVSEVAFGASVSGGKNPVPEANLAATRCCRRESDGTIVTLSILPSSRSRTGFAADLAGSRPKIVRSLWPGKFLDAASRRRAAKRSRRQDFGYTAPRTAASRRRDEAMVLVL
jgi:hypothetical protein